MEDRELYWYLLGLKSPWTVGGVSLDIKKRRVDVWAEHPEGQLWPCPQCSWEGRVQKNRRLLVSH